jgi:glycerophosphoryl diester phosphodiesterase
MTESSLKPAAGLGDTLSAKTRFSLRVVAGAGLTALVLALLTGRLLLSGVAMDDRSEIMAHRGASAAAPENTMAAVEKAIVDGAHWVEIDVQRTRDDHVVVVHDKDLMRIGGAPVVVSESLLRDVVSVDVGTWFGPNFSDQRIPTLGDVLHRCKAAIKVNIELKYYQWDERLARRVIDIVEKAAMQKDVAVMSLSAQAVRQVKELRPDWRVGLLSATALTDLVKVPCDFLAVHSRMATPKFVRRVHEAGKSLCVWTVNDAVGMLRMFDRGVDVLITDEPALAARLLQERKKLESAERLLMATGLMIVGQPQHLDPATDGF